MNYNAIAPTEPLLRGTCRLLNGSFAIRDETPVALSEIQSSNFVTCNSTDSPDHSHAYRFRDVAGSPDMLEFTSQQLSMPTECSTRWDGRTDCIWGFGVDDFSVSTWFRAGPSFGAGIENPAVTWANLLAKAQLGMTHPGVVVTLYKQDRIVFRLQQHPDYSLNVSCAECVSSGRWVFLTFIRHSNNLKIYQDGKLLGAKPVQSFDTRNTGTLRIGSDHVFPTGLNMDAWIDDFRIYDFALSDAGVRHIHGRTMSLDCMGVYPPLHGQHGTCNTTGVLLNGAEYSFLCKPGFKPQGTQPHCVLGHTVSSITCEPVQKEACMDARAMNFDSYAVMDDGSCLYDCADLVGQLGLNVTSSACSMVRNMTSSEWHLDLAIIAQDEIRLLQGLSSISQRDGRVQVTGGQLAMRHVSISNRANSFGGAIESSGGKIIVEHCHFAGNSANLNVDVPFAGSGGAIFAHGGGQVTIHSSHFVENTAAVQGGAIMLDTSVQCIMLATVFVGNVAFQGGGAIWTAQGNAYIENCVFERNEARGIRRRQQAVTVVKVSQMGISEGKGGAVFAFETPISVTGTTFSENWAFSGGALWTTNTGCDIGSSSFHGNFAAHSGGGIYAADSILTLRNSVLSHNMAVSGYGFHLESLRPGWQVYNTSVYPFDHESTVYTARVPLSGCAVHPCNPGFSCHLVNFSMFCTRCPQGMVSHNGITCKLCKSGTRATADNVHCETCPTGQHSRYGVCETCPRGTEAEINGTGCRPW